MTPDPNKRKHTLMAQPAHLTKHIPLLVCPFNNSSFALSQRADGVSNGTALWLGGQCLAMYLAHNLPRCHLASKRPSAIELGSGIGFTALALSSLGWDVLATDIPHVIQSVLRPNVTNNLAALQSGSGNVQVRELDWSVHPDNWTWDHESIIASPSPFPLSAPSLPHPSFDLIISADTVYAIELVNPFLRTLHALSLPSISSSSSTRGPPIFLCIERRDPMLVDRLLSDAKNEWGFVVERIPQKKVAKALEKNSVHWGKSHWEDIEIWKLRLVSL